MQKLSTLYSLFFLYVAGIRWMTVKMRKKQPPRQSMLSTRSTTSRSPRVLSPKTSCCLISSPRAQEFSSSARTTTKSVSTASPCQSSTSSATASSRRSESSIARSSNSRRSLRKAKLFAQRCNEAIRNHLWETRSERSNFSEEQGNTAQETLAISDEELALETEVAEVNPGAQCLEQRPCMRPVHQSLDQGGSPPGTSVPVTSFAGWQNPNNPIPMSFKPLETRTLNVLDTDKALFLEILSVFEERARRDFRRRYEF